MRFLCGNDTVAVAMHFAMKNGKIRFLMRKFLAISPAIQKIASDCGCDAVVHLGRDWGGWGWGPVPVPLRVGAPGKPLLRVSVACLLVCDLAPRVCDYGKVTCNGQCSVCHLV